ncbi:hypothetical protein HPB48_015296 [Haemaphysalis longicornis]|uniref:Uncharacterized protein n=1 Tax=Haemaphysalis longicornis TaxID=44386 RepID=A0A9J6FF73_HAELO|nr:hypothetical protein HPB48_015296 [Haemaphysalis longicornis]
MPAPRVLAADGLHPSYEGVAVMASHIRQLCLKETNSSSSSWADSASVPATGLGPSPSVLPKIVPSCLKPVDELSHLCCSNSPHNAQSPPVPLVPSAPFPARRNAYLQTRHLHYLKARTSNGPRQGIRHKSPTHPLRNHPAILRNKHQPSSRPSTDPSTNRMKAGCQARKLPQALL